MDDDRGGGKSIIFLGYKYALKLLVRPLNGLFFFRFSKTQGTHAIHDSVAHCSAHASNAYKCNNIRIYKIRTYTVDVVAAVTTRANVDIMTTMFPARSAAEEKKKKKTLKSRSEIPRTYFGLVGFRFPDTVMTSCDPCGVVARVINTRARRPRSISSAGQRTCAAIQYYHYYYPRRPAWEIPPLLFFRVFNGKNRLVLYFYEYYCRVRVHNYY